MFFHQQLSNFSCEGSSVMYSVPSIWNTTSNNPSSPHLLSDRITGHPTGHVLSNTDTSTSNLNCKFFEAIYLIQTLLKEAVTVIGLSLEEGRREIYIFRIFLFCILFQHFLMFQVLTLCTCQTGTTCVTFSCDHAVELNAAPQCS